MPALALTDHGAMYGAIDFYQAAKAAGIKPIIGVETYVARRSMQDREAEDKSSSHLLLLAKDYSGYKSLLKLVSASYTDGFYYKPRIDHEMLEKHHEGLIISSSCPSGEVARAILRDDVAAARKAADFYRGLVGADNYYLEIQDHGLADQKKINQGVLPAGQARWASPSSPPTTSTTSARSTPRPRRSSCASRPTPPWTTPTGCAWRPNNFYLRSPEEMRRVFSEVPEALSNTLRVAEQCDLKLDFSRVILPELDFIPEGMSPDEYLATPGPQGAGGALPRR